MEIDRKKDEGGGGQEKRQTRSQTTFQELSRKAPDPGTVHFGVDVTSQVRDAMAQNGSLDDTARGKMRGDIERGKRLVATPEKIMAKPFSDQLIDQFKKQKSVIQKDERVDPRSGGDYKGVMFTSSIVRKEHFEPDGKEIPQPSSPRPNDIKGYFHATHSSPYSLSGPEGNSTRTVYAPSWANISVDSAIEREAKNAVGEFGEGNVIHFRVDTSDRSTVGYAVYDVKSKSEDQRWQITSTQYKRKNL